MSSALKDTLTVLEDIVAGEVSEGRKNSYTAQVARGAIKCLETRLDEDRVKTRDMLAQALCKAANRDRDHEAFKPEDFNSEADEFLARL